jgi:zinc transporter 1
MRDKSNGSSEETTMSSSKELAFAVAAFLTSSFCIVELTFSIRLGSLALIADAFHNVSDVLSIAIAWHAHRLSRRKKSDDSFFTFAYRRAELLGGFFNLSSLISLSLFVVLEAIPRFIAPESTSNVNALYSVEFMGIAGAGIAMNLTCALIFGCAGVAAHGGHSHGHSHGHGAASHASHSSHSHDINDADADESSGLLANAKGQAKKPKLDVNILALLIHMVGDVFSSIVVLAMGLVIYFFGNKPWAPYVDPVASLVIVAIILASTLPAFKRITGVLMQRSPIDPGALRAELLKVGGVLSLHELHVWSVDEGTINIGTAHVVTSAANASAVCDSFRAVFHRFGVHNCTVQTELRDDGEGESCQSICAPNCGEPKCC